MSVDDILKTAQARSQQLGVPYAGTLTPQEAHTLRQQHDHATLVDVRTRAEWDWVGRVPDAVEIELMGYPGNRLNEAFIEDLEKKVPKDALVMFLCRSGGRSHNAAAFATEAGYSQCYNVLEGFEGDRDREGHRGRIGGWRFHGLPWAQG